MADAPPPEVDPGAASAGVEGRRPGPLRRAAAGAWHVIAGFAFLLRRPSFWPLAVLPSALTVVCLTLGFLAAYFLLPDIERLLLPGRGQAPMGLVLLLTVALWVGTFGTGLIVGLAVALLLSAPLLERLSRKVEAYVRVQVVEHEGGLKWELAQSFKSGLYFLAAAPGVLLLSLLPLVGPALGLLWGAHALALQQTDMALARRGLDFRGRRAWHRQWRAESLGFGAAGLFTMLAPCAALLLVPALTVGGTLFVLEFEEDLVTPDVPERRRSPRPPPEGETEPGGGAPGE